MLKLDLEALHVLNSSDLVLVFKRHDLQFIPKLLNLLMQLKQVLGVVFSVCYQRQLQILILIIQQVPLLVDQLQLLSESELHRVTICELEQLLRGELEVFLDQVFHLYESLEHRLHV